MMPSMPPPAPAAIPPGSAENDVLMATHKPPRPGCRTCVSLVGSLSYWMTRGKRATFLERELKEAIRKRDELDRTLVSMDGGVGHWRKTSKELSVLLCEKRADDASRIAELMRAAADREDDVERRVSSARDVLYELRKELGADTPLGQRIHQAWLRL